MPTFTSTYATRPPPTLPPTQTTAPVHEYRCLYTRDLHKKAKKWHDGYLRFHTFNQRVMVYDEARNSVGDLHYRQQDTFAPGIEIQLDRGLLVEVGEPMGETATDLTPILDRQRPEKPQQPTFKPPQPSRRPKSLLEVLGPSQTRHARSRLAIQSPYDQTHQISDTSLVQPSSKKPRLSFPSTVSQQPAAPLRPPVASPLPCMHVERVLDISSDDDTPDTSKSTAEPLALAHHSIPPAATTLQEATSHLKNNELNMVKSNNSGSIRKHRPAPKTKRLSPSNRSTASRCSPVQSPAYKHGRLLLSGPRPKPKLLCLLPLPRTSASHRPFINDAKSIDEPTGILNPPIELSSSLTITSPSQLSTPRVLTPRSSSSTRSGHRLGFDGELDSLEDSPLFLPDDNQFSKSPSQRPILTQEELGIMATCDAPPSSQIGQTDSPLQTSPMKHDPLENAHHGNDMLSIGGFQVSQSASPARDSIVDVATSPRDAMTVSSPAHGSVGRPFSGSNIQTSPVGSAFAKRASSQRTPLESLPNPPSRRSPSGSASPSKLRRHIFDTAALTEKRGETEPKLAGQGLVCEKGPWSGEEAFLLFDWWPPGLERPAYWTDLAPIQSRSLAVPLPVFSTRITTARQFFHDDMNM
ncbi:hypothetical protein PV10_05399 [Exophiala mesophila]|uniref:5'-3' DNA helicase ZGRF1-like N-terminal domain-containing protein n=1 Tax=Exophiala mesophila TaxID=212818 RepID=A0A0D1XRQ3_EXOME|nr:uncharacterized protein PV10_05399 [Exophiala mesophila]KIV90791.1 hypothetical protein PV10_05399 [Exophiala mesophila]